MQAALQEELASIQLYPEVPDVLSRLSASGVRWGILSNLAKPYAAPLLQLVGDNTPLYAGWSFQLGLRKPQPEIYHNVCSALGVTPEQALMVGDSLANDVVAPRSLGMHALFLQRQGRDVQLGCEGQSVTTIDSLLGVLGACGIWL